MARDPFVDDLVALLPRLRRYAISLTKTRDAADDLVQAACEKAIANRDRFVPGTRLDAWVMRILRNHFIDLSRRKGTEGPPADLDDHAYLVGDDGEAVTEHRLKLAETAKAIGQLSEPYRDVLILVCVEEFSYSETAEILGVPMGTVTSRLARARQKLVDMLDEKGSPHRSSAAEDT